MFIHQGWDYLETRRWWKIKWVEISRREQSRHLFQMKWVLCLTAGILEGRFLATALILHVQQGTEDSITWTTQVMKTPVQVEEHSVPKVWSYKDCKATKLCQAQAEIVGCPELNDPCGSFLPRIFRDPCENCMLQMCGHLCFWKLSESDFSKIPQ